MLLTSQLYNVKKIPELFSGKRIEALSEGGGYLYPSYPKKTSTFSLVPKNQNLDFLCSLFPQIAFEPLVSSVLGFGSTVPLK